MTILAVGTRIRDNDPRMDQRVLRISRFFCEGTEADVMFPGATHVRASGLHTDYRTRIAIRFIHTDDKPRRTGWSVVREDQPKENPNA